MNQTFAAFALFRVIVPSMKNFDHLFRTALLGVLVAGLIVAAWHLSWLHNQAGSRYEMQITDHAQVVVFDRQQRVIYAAYGVLGDEAPAVWKTSPLPK